MSEHNITVQGGSSVRLPTAGKYCDRDIVVTAEGGGDTDFSAVTTTPFEVEYGAKFYTNTGRLMSGEAVNPYTGRLRYINECVTTPANSLSMEYWLAGSGYGGIRLGDGTDITQSPNDPRRLGDMLCELIDLPMMHTYDGEYAFARYHAACIGNAQGVGPYITKVPDGIKGRTFTNAQGMFCYQSELKSYDNDIVFSNCTVSYMFYYCDSLTTINMDCMNAQNFNYMFSNCHNLQNVKLTNLFSQGTTSTGSMNYMFQHCTSLTNVEIEFAENPRFAGNIPFQYTFQACQKLQRIPYFDFVKMGTNSIGSMLYDCQALKEIPSLDLRNVTGVSQCFYNTKSVENIWVRNIKVNLQVGSGTTYGHLLTVDSLVNLIYECRDTGSTKTLTIGSANLEKLANVYVKAIDITDEMRTEDDLIDEKLPFAVCESTDEGAMLITDYVTLKNWKLA